MVTTTALNPRILQPGDIDPNWRWDKHIPSWGHTSVDFEKLAPLFPPTAANDRDAERLMTKFFSIRFLP